MKRKCLGAKLDRPEKTSCSGYRRIWDLRPNSETDLCPTPSRPEAQQPARMRLLYFSGKVDVGGGGVKQCRGSRSFPEPFIYRSLDPDYSFPDPTPKFSTYTYVNWKVLSF